MHDGVKNLLSYAFQKFPGGRAGAVIRDNYLKVPECLAVKPP